MGGMNSSDEIRIIFRDRKPEMALAWSRAFTERGPWSFGVGSVLAETGDAAVSPANSFGRMDGGIDLAYRNHFGLHIERTVRTVIENDFGGELPVGRAVIVPTGNRRIPRLVVAPTMRRPGDISETENAYLAMRAALEAVREHNEKRAEAPDDRIRTLLVPGMGTGVGGMGPSDAADQMKRAVIEVLGL